MAFNVKARVLLELGAELISSDGIALYELIKNAVDAGSESIEIRFQVALTPSGYKVFRSKLRSLAESHPNSALRSDLLEEATARYFDPIAPQKDRDKFVATLTGEVPSAALIKLEKFYRQRTFIEVEDWGCGMSESDLKNKFLTIGTPNRANQRRKEGAVTKVLGEKGIGRLSAMRLGLKLDVLTSMEGEQNWSTLSIDWSELRSDPDLNLDEFVAEPKVGAKKKSAREQGTLLTISDLQSDWSLKRLRDLARAELSKIQDPFDEDIDVLDLSLSYNEIDVTAIEELDTDWMKKWHGEFTVSFGYEKLYPDDPDDHRMKPVLSGTARFRVPDPDEDGTSTIVDEAVIASSGDSLYATLSSVEFPVAGGTIADDPARYAGIDTLGPFEATGYWFNRQRAQTEFGEEYEKFKGWLEQWAGGLLMYRDGYRVYPYAAPDDDWLELDQKALRRKSFKLNRGQFVGHVRITSHENPELRDQTNRQGLCDSPEKRALIQCLQHVIWKELGALVTKYEAKSASRSLSTVREIETQVKERARDAKGKLRELAKRAPEERETVAELRGYVEELESAWTAAKKAIKKQEGQAELYLHLAGVGMLLEFIIHELNRVTHSTLTDLQTVPTNSLPPGLRSLSRQLQTLDKRLRILDPVSTPGRQRKEECNVNEVIETLFEAHEQQFERHSISANLHIAREGKTLIATVIVGQMYQVFENLIANSVYWLTHLQAMHRTSGISGLSAAIDVYIDTDKRTITFRDNGPGIEWADREKIFEPFFSKKPSGRGIGLYIVKNLCKENGIVISVLDREVGEDASPGFMFQFP